MNRSLQEIPPMQSKRTEKSFTNVSQDSENGPVDISPQDLMPVHVPSKKTEKSFPVVSKDSEGGPVDISPGDLIPIHENDVEEWFAAGSQEARADLMEKYEATKNQDTLGEAVDTALEEAAKAETVAAKKAGKGMSAFADTLTFGKNLLIDTPLALYDYLKTETEDLTHDVSDAVLGTAATDKMKGWWKNMFGKQNAEIRQPEEQHRGARDVFTMEVTAFAKLWEEISSIPKDIARRLDDWSPESMQANTELATEMEEIAWDERNKVLFALEAEEKQTYSAGLSKQELTKALQRIQDKKDIADSDYNDAVQEGNAVKVGVGGAVVKGSAWWATRGIPKTIMAFIPAAADYLA
ncbi:MAG: hypothetical protein AAB448_02705, partial [Patescibacteria group bacterium]